MCQSGSRMRTAAGAQGCLNARSWYPCASQVLRLRRMDWVTRFIGFHGRCFDLQRAHRHSSLKYLDEKVEESMEVLTSKVLDQLIADELRTDMAHSEAKSRIENLFVFYHAMLPDRVWPGLLTIAIRLRWIMQYRPFGKHGFVLGFSLI